MYAIPPNKIVKTTGNTRVGVSQISVFGGDSNAIPTGWKGFEEYISLAFVKFQIRIFRNGKMFVADEVGPYSYRGGELPELVQVKNLDRDRDLEGRSTLVERVDLNTNLSVSLLLWEQTNWTGYCIFTITTIAAKSKFR